MDVLRQEMSNRLQGPGSNSENVAAVMWAIAACEMPAMAAAFHENKKVCAEFSAQAANRTASATRQYDGDDAWLEMHGRTADLARSSLPEFNLP